MSILLPATRRVSRARGEPVETVRRVGLSICFQSKTSGGRIHATGYSNGSSLEKDALDRTHHERFGCAVPAHGRGYETGQPGSCRGGNDQARISLTPHFRYRDRLAGRRCSVCHPAYVRPGRDLADRLSGRRSRQPTARWLAPVQQCLGTGLYRCTDLGRAFLARSPAARAPPGANELKRRTICKKSLHSYGSTTTPKRPPTFILPFSRTQKS